MALKDWEPTENSPGSFFRHKGPKRQNLRIEKLRGRQGYMIFISHGFWGASKYQDITEITCKTKSQALAFAKAYMRKH